MTDKLLPGLIRRQEVQNSPLICFALSFIYLLDLETQLESVLVILGDGLLREAAGAESEDGGYDQHALGSEPVLLGLVLHEAVPAERQLGQGPGQGGSDEEVSIDQVFPQRRPLPLPVT